MTKEPSKILRALPKFTSSDERTSEKWTHQNRIYLTTIPRKNHADTTPSNLKLSSDSTQLIKPWSGVSQLVVFSLCIVTIAREVSIMPLTGSQLCLSSVFLTFGSPTVSKSSSQSMDPAKVFQLVKEMSTTRTLTRPTLNVSQRRRWLLTRVVCLWFRTKWAKLLKLLVIHTLSWFNRNSHPVKSTDLALLNALMRSPQYKTNHCWHRLS